MVKAERPEDLDFEEFEEDFDEQDASYQVWILGYDENEAITDYELLVKSFSNAERAVEYAKEYVDEGKYQNETFPDNVNYIEVLVETVVEFEDRTENVGTLFTAQLEI